MSELSAIPTDLRVENQPGCLGVDKTAPLLGWCLPDNAAAQVRFQVQAASSREHLAGGQADLWDSGEVNSPDAQAVAYGGKPLASAQHVFWRVRIRSDQGALSDWSEISSWTMGILNQADWRGARWITASAACLDPQDPAHPDGGAGSTARPIGIDCAHYKEKDLLARHVPAQSILLRTRFATKTNLSRALLFSSGLAHYVATIDERPASDRLLAPGWSNYRKTVLYDTTDVTDHLAAVGEHELRLLIGNGMYSVYYTPDRYVKFINTFGAQKAIALLVMQYADGTTDYVTTQTSWQAGLSPVTYSNVYGGEDLDLRLENDPRWEPAIPVDPPGVDPLLDPAERLGLNGACAHTADLFRAH